MSFPFFTFEVGSSTSVTASGPGDFNPFVVEVVGPADLLSMMQDVTIGGQTYKLAGGGVSGGERFLASQNAPATPRAFMAAPSPALSAPPPEPTPWSQSRTLNFAQGFGAGLLDTGVDWWDGIKSVAKTSWHVVKNYNPFVVYYKLAMGESTVVVEDQQAAYSAWDTAEAIAKIAGQIITNEGNLFYEALGGNVEAINRLGEQYTLAFEAVAELLSSVKDEILNMSAYDGGRIAGRIVGEAVLTVATTLATAGVGAVVKSTVIPKVITKLKSANYIPAAVINKLETTAIKLVTALTRTKMCFVAGTPVHTKAGLVAIEEVRPGDLVLSRDPETGEQGYKPVVETFVTRPSQLLRVHYHAAGGQGGVLTGTREHPFYVAAVGRFVPVGELIVGDVLSLADGAEVTVSALVEEEAEPDRPFTTYNFAVADYHTYFAGEAGLWVHNNGQGLCERIFSIYNGVKLTYGLEDQPWEAFKILLKKTSKVRWWVNAAFGDTVDEVMQAAYKQAIVNGKVNLSAVPKAKEIYQAIGAVWKEDAFGPGHPGWVGSRFSAGTPLKPKLLDYGLEVHHTAVTKWARFLIGRPLSQAELDDMPALLIRKVKHQTSGGIGAFHGILVPNGTYSKQQILDGLKRAYRQFYSQDEPDVWLVARAWLETMGVQ